MGTWVLAKKELRLLLRDRVAAVLLLGMPLLFILILGLLLGESFGQKPDDTLRISLVDLDAGKGLEGKPWSHWVRTDLAETPGIRIEVIRDRAEAERLIRDHRRAAILVFEPDFSERIERCSFLDTRDSINPFHREGVYLDRVRATLLKDASQLSAAALIEQVVQVTMLRVILPFMIGQAFSRLSDPDFIHLLGREVTLPVPQAFRRPLAVVEHGPIKGALIKPRERMTLQEMLDFAAGKNKQEAESYRGKVGAGVQAALKQQFRKFDLTGKTWAALTKSQARPLPVAAASAVGLSGAPAGPGPLLAASTLYPGGVREGSGAEVSDYQERDGSGLLRRGAHRYQVLVPSYTVMFAFFLVLTVGWVFVAERRQGTLQRLRAAPLTRGQVLLGKLVPCFAVSLGQGVFLLTAGRLLFGMRWGPDHWSLAQQAGWLFLVVFSTSLAAMGLALLVAAVARSEMQVAIFGALPVLVLALIGGCVLPRELMPEQTQRLSLLTPQGWALDAYRELLNASATYEPNLTIVLQACAVLSGFGLAFLALAWGLLRLE
jgi:ABC-type multidrug transport system permease subunit